MNPGSPAPQASVLILTSRSEPRTPTSGTVTRPRAQTQRVLHEDRIINTLLELKNDGKYESTLKTTAQKLRQLSKNADLMKPNEVLTFIANHQVKNSVKQKLVNCYEYFCKTNGLTFKKPKYRIEYTVPIIPTTENVTKIISASNRKYALIFTILAETGFEGMELHTLHRNNIDTQQGIISIEGHKGHDSGVYKLKPQTAEMLREYLANNPQDYPFPHPENMSDAWQNARNRVARNLKQPDLKKIPMKNLRNYSGAHLYLTLPIRDPIAVMRRLRHKKLETTMHYIRGIALTFEEDANYICRTSNNIKEDTELIENGFAFVTEREGVKLFRKRK